jgi:outer membrane lipoprotein-sorting protein
MASQTVIRVLLIIIILIMLCGVLQADKVETTYQQMLKAYSNLNSWQAVISQTNYYVQTKTTLNSTGTFYYQKGKAAIRYNKPNEQSLIIQNGTVKMYDKSSNTVIKSRLVSAVQSLNPVEIVKTYWQKSDKTVIQSTEQSTILSIKPKADEQIKEIKATVGTKSGYITKLVYLDMQGNSVSIAFSKLKINKPIPASVWKLNYPKTAKVFEQ